MPARNTISVVNFLSQTYVKLTLIPSDCNCFISFFLQLELSKVILEDLPKEFAKALRSYNEQVTKVFRQYLTTVAAEHERSRGEENKLPLSGIGEKLPH